MHLYNAFNNNYQPIIDSNYIVESIGTGIYKSFGARPIIKNNFIQFVQYGVEWNLSYQHQIQQSL